MGPRARYLGPEVPAEALIWQDPVPAVDHPLIDAADIAALKAKILASGLTVSQLVSTAWASASTFRGSDKRGGANGARIRLAPRRTGRSTSPPSSPRSSTPSTGIQQAFNDAQPDGKRVSLADLIVLGGTAAVEEAARKAGHDVAVPFAPGRTDATDEQTDAASFAVLEPVADGFRNYLKPDLGIPAEQLLVDKAQLLTLTAPEMTVLVGGLRVLGANADGAQHGVLTTARRPSPPTSSSTSSTCAPPGSPSPPPRTSSRAATARPASPAGPAPASTSSSAPTPSSARWPRSTPATAPRRSSSATSSPPGPR